MLQELPLKDTFIYSLNTLWETLVLLSFSYKVSVRVEGAFEVECPSWWMLFPDTTMSRTLDLLYDGPTATLLQELLLAAF